MTKVTVKVNSEYYRVMEGSQKAHTFDSPSEAVRFAMTLAVRDNYHSIGVERITCHSPAEGIFGPVTESSTGYMTIMGPAGYAADPALSRYHPVNGWALPETIEIEPTV